MASNFVSEGATWLELLTGAGPYGVSILALSGWFYERRRSEKLQAVVLSQSDALLRTMMRLMDAKK